MGEKEDKEKAEKLAAAKKRVAQMKKKQQKAGGDKEKKPAKDAGKDTTAPADEAPAEATEEAEVKEEDQPAAEEEKPAEETKAEAADTVPEDEAATAAPSRPSHGRQPSMSVQSQLRSSSFRRTSTNGPASPSLAIKSPAGDLPPLTPDSSTITDIYRKQASRLEELERENKRLEKEVSEGETRWRKSEEELEELREMNGETTALRDKAKKADDAQKEVEKLKAEISSLQRQHRSHSMSISKPLRSPSVSVPDSSNSPDPETKALLSSKDATIADMELEISNLRAQLSDQTSSCTTHGSQISALTTQLSTAEAKVKELSNELADTKKSLTRASEKAVKDGVERTSSDTKIRSLERELDEAKSLSDEVTKKAETLEKKLEAMNKLHRESEARMQAKLVTAEKEARDLVALKKKLVILENENARLKDEQERRRRKEASATAGGDTGLDELEDEERLKLERRIRDLEGENFDLRRGVWKEKRKGLEDELGDDPTSTTPRRPDEDFDEVDLSGGRRRSTLNTTSSSSFGGQQKHSSFTTVLSSGLAAFRAPANQPSARANLLDGDDLLDDDDDAFDEHAFANAQREEEARKMVEHVREVKRKLKEWQDWRLDLVETRRSAGFGAGIGGGAAAWGGFGEIFEV